ncbi:MAG: hypothetical protein ACKVQA_21150 [Burkholderiales bacterium]
MAAALRAKPEYPNVASAATQIFHRPSQTVETKRDKRFKNSRTAPGEEKAKPLTTCRIQYFAAKTPHSAQRAATIPIRAHATYT